MTTKRSPFRLNPWPIGLVLWFAFFISLCVWFVGKSLGMKYDLVTKEYYQEGLKHDERQKAIARTKALETSPSIEIDVPHERLIIRVPDFAHDAVLTLYRPSDSRLDKHYDLQDGAPSQISLLDLHPGRWEARISWQTDQKNYLHEEKVDLP